MIPRTIRNGLLSSLLLAGCLVPALAQDAAPQAPEARPRPTYIFQVALLVAEKEGSGSLRDLPPNTLKAIQDIREFLPFKSYRLVDVSLLRSDHIAQATINGPQGELYGIHLRVAQTSEEHLIEVRGFVIASDDHNLISTSSTVNLGETIVVGTSKLDGTDKALVTLFTVIH